MSTSPSAKRLRMWVVMMLSMDSAHSPLQCPFSALSSLDARAVSGRHGADSHVGGQQQATAWSCHAKAWLDAKLPSREVFSQVRGLLQALKCIEMWAAGLWLQHLRLTPNAADGSETASSAAASSGPTATLGHRRPNSRSSFCGAHLLMTPPGSLPQSSVSVS